MSAKVSDMQGQPGRRVAEERAETLQRLHAENVKSHQKQNVVFSVSKAISIASGVGHTALAPDGAIVKVAGMQTLPFSGPRGLRARERTLKRAGMLALLFALAFAATGPAAATGVTFASPSAAVEQGIGAYRAGHYQLAEPALKFAADAGDFFGQFYLAQLYSDNNSAHTNHGKAYKLFVAIVDENANADPDDDQRAPYVGKALTAVAGYTRRGLAEIALAPNAERAAKFYRDAATFFRDYDAQFELAKMHLKGEGVPLDQRQALHWLSTLTQEGHAGAQAFLADLLWRGKDVPKDEKRALALIQVAIANAPERDRIWIEDIYQNIFCGSSSGIRADADGLVAVWKRMYSPRTGIDQGEQLGMGLAARSCGNGEQLPELSRQGQANGGRDQRTPASVVPDTKALQGGAASGLREIGTSRR